ncbi:MAG: ornithine cyclodeaminase family protein [Sedimentibacter sp.]|uniref:ornithine cyclodeaminase family protein n=1 Tax=Sedimentibacter sp. TaxID=1960295 RepID=UPI003159107B
MFDIKVLSKADTEKLLKMNDVINVVENVYRSKSENKTCVFPLIFHEFEPGVADMDIKSGWLKESNIFGLKLVSWFGENVKKDLPALIGAIMVMDSTTGVPIGILDGAHITGMRTGAAGALGAKYLARPDSKTLLIVGAGHVSTFQMAATLLLFPDLKTVMIYDPMNFNTAITKAETIKDTLKNNFDIKVDEKVKFTAVSDIKDATGISDIIITVTPSRKPIIMKEWVKPGTHFSCIGADMSGKEEIDPEIFRDARVFGDDITQCINVGETEIPVALGIISKEHIAGEIGDIISGKTTGRENNDQITIFDATGIALLDLATAKLALDEAKRNSMGSTVDL